ncbi:hypothetical protein [Candidatus Poriferisodalis sp.]|uniref:hypothetical protein n=1 Tax=Candidatus Poriferisodalis sp. TaxID=3101277 RepID=UPI003B0299A4
MPSAAVHDLLDLDDEPFQAAWGAPQNEQVRFGVAWPEGCAAVAIDDQESAADYESASVMAQPY